MTENRNDTENLGELLKIRREKLTALQEAGQDPFQITKFDKKNTTVEIQEHFDELEEQPVSVAGRLMSKRVMGKVTFCDQSGAALPPALCGSDHESRGPQGL